MLLARALGDNMRTLAKSTMADFLEELISGVNFRENPSLVENTPVSMRAISSRSAVITCSRFMNLELKDTQMG